MRTQHHRSRRTAYMLLAAVFICVMLSSSGSGISIDRRGLVHAMGIDSTGSGYRISLQIFQPSGGAENSVDVTKPNVSVTVSEGKTVGEAVAAAGSSSGKELFFGHLQLICLGSDIKPDDPYGLFAFALGDKNISPSVDICCCSDTAEKLMQTKLTDEETSAQALCSLIKNGSNDSQTISCDLKELLSSQGCCAVPVLSVNEDAEDESGENSKALSECVVISGTRVYGSDITLDSRESAAAAMLSGRAKNGCTVTELDGNEITCIIEKCRRCRKLIDNNGVPVLYTKLTVSARPDRELDPEKSRELGEKISQELESECLALQNKLFSNGADIFGTVQLIRQRMPKYAVGHSNDIPAMIRSVRTVTEVEVKTI